MTETNIIMFCQQLITLVETDQLDLQLVLDAADIIAQQLEKIRELEARIANLKAEGARCSFGCGVDE